MPIDTDYPRWGSLVVPNCGRDRRDRETSPPTTTSRTAQRAYALNAGVAWTGAVLTVLFSALEWYERVPVEPGLYQVVLAPGIDGEGWSLLTDPLLHAVTPLVTAVVWAGWGPRGWITARLLPGALAVPLLWIVWMIARGAVIDACPYGFAKSSSSATPPSRVT